jgi:hypothetical protein
LSPSRNFPTPHRVVPFVAFVVLQITCFVPVLQANHATFQVRKSCTARKDSVRRR